MIYVLCVLVAVHDTCVRNVTEFKCLGKTLTIRNCMSEEMKQPKERYRMFCVLVAVQEINGTECSVFWWLYKK